MNIGSDVTPARPLREVTEAKSEPISSATASSSRSGRQLPLPRKSGDGKFNHKAALVGIQHNNNVQPKGSVDLRKTDEATIQNDEFFQRMEKDFTDICAQDGWDDIRRAQE